MRNPESGAELREIAAKEKLPLSIAALDVDDDASVAKTIGQVLAEKGSIDVLVNNAGVSGRGSVEEVPLEGFRQVMETNFFGILRCVKAVVPGMRKRRSGCIINIASVAGRMAMAPHAPYAASKFAVEALSECLAQEVKAFNIRVAIIEPGVIATPIFSKGGPMPVGSPYPHLRRLMAMFAASLKKKPVSPYVVGEQIREIVEGDSWQLRYPVGPDAAPFLKWRADMSDEQWVAFGGLSDADWAARVKRDFGLDVTL
jgi:NAD(P)-dependent dehydrogenase (short-subunit alcohol dehydrogenase family)